MHKITVQYPTPADTDAFETRYAEEHAPLVRAIPGLERFTLTHPRAMAGAAPYLVAEMWFGDADALKAALRSPEMGAAGAHAAGFGLETTMFSGEVSEHA